MEVIGQGSWYKRKLSWQLAAQAMSASNATSSFLSSSVSLALILDCRL
jgi:hypothetical protein